MPETDLDALLAAAIAHHQAGRPAQAAPLYRQILAAAPDHAKANHLLGAVLVAQGQPQEGARLLGRAADLDPGQPNYRYSHGVALQMLGDVAGATAAYESTLRAAPGHAQAHNNLGILAQAAGRNDQAIAHFRRVTELAPALAAGHFNLANALADSDARAAAIAAYRQAAALDPARVEILYNLAATLRQDGQLDAAADAFAQVLARDPGHVQARAQSAFLKQHFADWSAIASLAADLVPPALAAPPDQAVSPFLFLALPIDVPAATLRQIAAKMQARYPAGPPLAHRDRSPRARLRIGYVSADFFDHATAHLTRTLFARHDRAAVEVFGYALGTAQADDPYRRDIAKGCDHFIELGALSARAAAERIAADRIDILVDLKGHTQGNRLGLFAHRPAPIQATWLGYPGTTGLDFIDYALVDKIVAPPEHQAHYSEKLVWLPNTYQVNDDTQPIAASAPTRAQCGLPATGFVFCCFNAVTKIEPLVFAAWMRILQQVPGSVLWLYTDLPRAQDNLRRTAAQHGIDPARLVFASPLPKDAHLARHAHADLFLDTIFYNAHTTASDALWAGVPVLTCPGQTFARRVGASLLTAIGLPDLIAPDLAGYEALAVRLAREPALLQDVRARLAANRTRSPLFDTTRFARHLESAFRLMWQRHARGETPAAIEVAADTPAPSSAAGTGPLLAAAIRAAESGDGAKVAALCQQILADEPGNAQALHLLATTEANAGRLPVALQLAQRAIAAAPQDADHHYLRAVLLQMQGDGAGAAQGYERVLQLAPDHASAHNNLGVLHQSAGRNDRAARHFREVTRLAPELAAGYFNLANVLDALGDLSGAVAALRQAIALEPERLEFHYNLAAALHRVPDLQAALASYERALSLDPTRLSTRAQIATLRQQLCDWRAIDRLRADLVEPALAAVGERSPNPFILLTLPIEISPAELRIAAANYGRRRAAKTSLRFAFPAERRRQRLRIGYVSADFHNHATAHLIRGLFARHDRAAVEVVGYALGAPRENSTYRQEIVRNCDRFVDLAFLTEEDCAQRIHQDGIDILVDLKGHTQDNRMGLFAYRPAPVQVTWLGYPASTGVDFFDYAIVDKIVAPPADQPHWSENLVWMPHSYQVNDDTQAIAPTTPSRAECGLPEQGFVFCSFNAAYKIEPVIFSTWMNILRAVPGSVLWLYPGSLPTQDHLRREAAARGIDPARLVFAPNQRKDLHLARHRHADLFLDTYFCNAHTTASDALWACVPLITCPGRNFAQRVAASLLTALDLPDLIATDLADYERKAIALARNPAALAALRARLAASRTKAPLFDTTRFARDLEAAYRMMWDIYARGEAPRAFAVGSPETIAPAAPAFDIDAAMADAEAHHKAARMDQAAAGYRSVLAVNATHARALHQLGLIEAGRQRLREAADLTGRAAAAAPGEPEYHFVHGVMLQHLGDTGGAGQAYERTLRLAPDHAFANNNLGVLHQAAGRFEAAAAHFTRATAANPGLVTAHFHLGNVLDELGDQAGAIKAYEQALALAPDRKEIHYNLATTLRRAGRLEESVASFERARALDPAHLLTASQLALTRLQLCDWSAIGRLRAELIEPALAAAPANAPPPFAFVTLPVDIAPAELRRLAANYGARHAARAPLAGPSANRARERLRVGYVSTDFRNHPVAHLVRGLFARHDRAAVEIVGYALGAPRPNNSYRNDIAQGCDRFVELGFLPDEAAAKRIAADAIDVLVDLNGYTQDNRIGLFAYRPAPVQATWLGYPGTTGVAFFDYVLVDKVVAPPQDQAHFSEKLVWLPEAYQVNDDTQAIAADLPSRAECGLPDDGFVFCCFNASYKIEPMIFAAWMEILRAVPGSVLWLFAGAPAAQANLRRAAAAHGIDPARLVFAPHRRKEQHLARHRHADLFLDTYFYNAHTTASDALWAGVPLLTVPGRNFAQRVAASLLTAIGLPELIAPDLDAYRRRAIELARDRPALAELRARIAASRRQAPLFDTTRFARHLERAYRMMWEIYQRGEAPRAFDVPALPPAPRLSSTSTA